MAKSSSLESLHNARHHLIKRDSSTDLRNRETRNSFRRAVDRSIEDSGERQVGVDGECQWLCRILGGKSGRYLEFVVMVTQTNWYKESLRLGNSQI